MQDAQAAELIKVLLQQIAEELRQIRVAIDRK